MLLLYLLIGVIFVGFSMRIPSMREHYEDAKNSCLSSDVVLFWLIIFAVALCWPVAVLGVVFITVVKMIGGLDREEDE